MKIFFNVIGWVVGSLGAVLRLNPSYER